MDTILKISSGLLLVLNEDRQVVTVNHGLADALGIKDITEVLGLRFGEIVSCSHAVEEPNGCGTTPHCATCGAVIATMACINGEASSEQVCSLNKQDGNVKEDMVMLIRTQSILIEGQKWILFFAQDITQESFWMNLERVFFHDISNLLASLLGNCELLKAEFKDNKRVHHMTNAILKLCNEVSFQRSLSSNRNTKYEIEHKIVSIGEIREELHLIVDGHGALKNRRIRETWPNEAITIKTDILLVSKVLGNMVLNALEATPEKGEIQITVTEEPGNVFWQIWNASYIPEDFQRRLFQRYFSTKADMGRGLGTYSMKLFGEKYLKGRVDFTSDAETGTVFSFSLPR